LAAGGRTPASAQVVGSDNELGKNWELKLGFFIPERESSRAAEGDVWFAVGAERAVYSAERWKGTFSIDYYGSGRTYNIPITLNARGESQRIRYGGGAGIGLSHGLSEGHTGFAYNLLVGYVLKQGANPVTADIRYQGLSTSHSELNGWDFTLGLHF